ncbi:Hypothetical protein R9X50_00679200 [Acrodontium crateriforme]|uniref:Uncharacterized protein n=1 Tax=Acrodontium crateriforme TaxID=150365 RepID=A0AAQ3M9J3_9PEZI|nr:Hypothetical protein R9X50_00679200 [Acrodontium crateriforme]
MDKNADKDDGTWPDQLFKAMEDGHQKFLKDRQEPSPSTSNNEIESRSTTNPFIAFKDFVDSQIQRLSENVRKTPANIFELRKKAMEHYAEETKEREEAWYRWTGRRESLEQAMAWSHDNQQQVPYSGISVALEALRSAHAHNASVPWQKLQALYQESPLSIGSLDKFASPMLSPGGACYYMAESANSGCNQVSNNLTTWTPPYASNLRWLSTGWFQHSPYSPVNIEGHPDLGCNNDGRWRLAFEELINASLGKDLDWEGDAAFRSSKTNESQPGRIWMLGLQLRGVLPPQLPSLYIESPEDAQKLWQAASQGPVWTKGRLHSISKEMHSLMEVCALPRAESYEEPEVEEDLYDDYYMDHRGADSSGSGALTSHAVDKFRELQKRDQQVSERSIVEATADKQQTELLKWGKEFDDMLQALAGQYGLGGLVDEVKQYMDEMSHLNQNDLFEGLKQQVEAFGSMMNADQTSRVEKTRSSQYEQEPSTPLEQTKPEDITPSKVDVLSSLTTTQTTRHPDGTITTKVMLRERFADGREETHEKLHTYRDPSPKEERIEDGEKTESPKKAWFWS